MKFYVFRNEADRRIEECDPYKTVNEKIAVFTEKEMNSMHFEIDVSGENCGFETDEIYFRKPKLMFLFRTLNESHPDDKVLIACILKFECDSDVVEIVQRSIGAIRSKVTHLYVSNAEEFALQTDMCETEIALSLEAITDTKTLKETVMSLITLHTAFMARQW